MSQTGPSNSAKAGASQRAAAGSNRRLAGGLVAFAAFMIGLSFASVPLYRMFCAATGFAGTPQRAAAASGKVFPETVTVRFDANVTRNLPWSFDPVQPEMTLHVGENQLAFFRATNKSKETVTGSAVFNVSPEIMGQYFTKIQCFCFTEQTLKPGETVEMPVSFFIDPAVLNDRDAKTVRDMTLSYTFYKVQTPASAPVANLAPARGDASSVKAQNPG
ncbi:MAG: cytochrome c oxidase assembly protein [Rhodomicrobium sp.]|nr:cytochrome c oxidase assembly protein [Rhodomicrobium sp.]